MRRVVTDSDGSPTQEDAMSDKGLTLRAAQMHGCVRTVFTP
jgi:hypothetical protein